MARPMLKCLGLILVVSLGLFFGLFFGLNYLEIVRHGTAAKHHPANRAHAQALIHRRRVQPQRMRLKFEFLSYSDRQHVRWRLLLLQDLLLDMHFLHLELQLLLLLIDQPSGLHSVLPNMLQRRPPTALFVSGRQQAQRVLRPRLFEDVNKANDFFTSHTTNSTSFCYYNPANETQVLFDVSFTKWKWAITSIFGICPLFVTLSLGVYFLALLPLWNLARAGWADMQRAMRTMSLKSLSLKGQAAAADSSFPDIPPAYKEREDAN
ncbi:hypothetical protein GGX14DRAFT_580968 [Mycena pura]|uniref:Uncharacterized protein n=1 Tax=Mycena pura TaxID=153505 RepID=A0AAD6Y2T1_9AGAR|nr:hypothetical protein GGX14DRAFT_580968 [Mycena pura]